jgi:hypothetical protein
MFPNMPGMATRRVVHGLLSSIWSLLKIELVSKLVFALVFVPEVLRF